jgi:segregation and condensation protein B
MTYATTPAFLEYFGLPALDGLPSADELRRIPVTRPDALVTAEPGLATAPPEQLSLTEVEPVATPGPGAGETPPPPTPAAA